MKGQLVSRIALRSLLTFHKDLCSLLLGHALDGLEKLLWSVYG
jgi:hypothetical protein